MPDPVDPSGAYLWDPALNDWVLNPAYAASPLPDKPKGGNGRTALIILAIIAVIVVWAAFSGGGSDGTTPEPTPTPTVAESTPTPEPTEDPASEVLADYIALTDRIVSTSADIAEAGSVGDVNAMDVACADLGEEAVDGIALGSTGFPDADQHWDAAMVAYASAADACLAGNYDKAADYINEATVEINGATEALGAAG